MNRLAQAFALIAALGLASGCTSWSMIHVSELPEHYGADIRVKIPRASSAPAIVAVNNARVAGGLITGTYVIEQTTSAADAGSLRRWISQRGGIPLQTVHEYIWVSEDNDLQSALLVGAVIVIALAVIVVASIDFGAGVAVAGG